VEEAESRARRGRFQSRPSRTNFWQRSRHSLPAQCSSAEKARRKGRGSRTQRGPGTWPSGRLAQRGQAPGRQLGPSLPAPSGVPRGTQPMAAGGGLSARSARPARRGESPLLDARAPGERGSSPGVVQPGPVLRKRGVGKVARHLPLDALRSKADRPVDCGKPGGERVRWPCSRVSDWFEAPFC